MNKRRILKKLGSLAMTLAVVLALLVPALPAYASETAHNTISIKYDPGIDGLDSTQFKLYKVGKFVVSDSGSSIELVDPFTSCGGVVLNGIDPTDTEAWLIEANKLGTWAKTNEGSLPTPDWSGSLEQSSAFQTLKEGGNAKSFSDGVYLLVGEETPQAINERFWTPVPVLIRVLNENTEFTIESVSLKMKSRPLVHKHVVLKAWQDDGDPAHRPAAVKVGLYNGSTQVDTIEMSDSKGWDYTWYSYKDNDDQWVYTSKDPEDAASVGVETENLNEGNSFQLKCGTDNHSWDAQEVLPATYGENEHRYIPIITDGEGNGTSILTITNVDVLPAKHDPPVKKVVTGDKPKKDETFEFSLTAISTDANVEKMPMPEGSNGTVKTITAKAGEEKEFGDIIFRIPGQYIYEIAEVDTGKKGYKYDDSVYQLVYDLVEIQTAPGEYELEMTLHVYKDGVEVFDQIYVFENEYSDNPPTGDETNILVPAAIFVGALIILVLFFMKRKKNN